MAKVKNIESSMELLSLLEKSQLLADEKLEVARQACNANEDPKSAARQLLRDGLITNWQANQLLAGFAALRIGSYKLLDQVGKGELGRVYLAEHSKMGHKVALKTLASKSATDPQLVERFLAEARAAGAFEHRNVLRVLDVASDEDRPFVISEFVSGGDLQQRVEKNGPLPAREAADLIAQASEGMTYVHSKGVLHRDLKPANLLVDDKGTLKIVDVGVGQLRQAEKSGNENTGELLLSALGYLSPEQIRGKDLDARSDIYALGGTLYFLLTGRVPYTAANNDERDIIRKTKRPVPLTTLKADIPAELAIFCDQMMSLKSSDRPSSMEEVSQRLRKFIQAPQASPSSTAAAPAPVAATPKPEEPAAPPEPVAAASSETPAPPAADSNITSPAQENSSASPQSVAVDTANIEVGEAEASEDSEPIQTGIKIQKKKKDAAEAAAPVAKKAAAPVAKKAAVVAKTEVAEESKDRQSVLPANADKAKRQRVMLIGGIAVALVVIIGGIGAMLMTSGNEATEVASTAPPGAAAAAPSTGAASTGAPSTGAASTGAASTGAASDSIANSAPANAGSNSADAGPGLDPAVLAAAAAISSSAAAAPAAATPPAPPANAPAAAAAVGTPGPASPPATTAPATTAQPSAPAATPAPPVTPAAEPKKDEPKPDPAKKDEPKKDEPKKDDPKKDEPKSEPAKTEPAKTDKPAAPPKSEKVFEIANAVDLPRLPAADGSAAAEAPAKVLGKINLGPSDTCFIAMFGGDKAMKGRHEFLVRSAKGGTAPRDWEVVEKESSGTEVVLATLSLPAQELQFEWTPDGLKNPNSGAVRNCALKITAGQEKPQTVALRTPHVAPPMTIENIEKAVTARFNFESVPDGSALRLEPTIPNQKIVFEAAGADITKGDQLIFVGETKEAAPVAFKLDTSVTARGIQITAESFVLIPGEKPQRLTPALRKRVSIPDLQRQAKNLGDQQEALKKLKKDDLATASSLAKEQMEKAIQRLQKLDEISQQLNGNGKIHFRIYYDTGEGQIDLVKTDDNAPPTSK